MGAVTLTSARSATAGVIGSPTAPTRSDRVAVTTVQAATPETEPRLVSVSQSHLHRSLAHALFPDVDECASASACDALTTCQNKIGSFDCSGCPTGFTGDGKSGCVGGYSRPVSRLRSSCRARAPLLTDVNECLVANGFCDRLTVCTNVPGSRMCSPCPAGYSGAGDAECKGEIPCSSCLLFVIPLLDCRYGRMSVEQWELRSSDRVHQHAGQSHLLAVSSWLHWFRLHIVPRCAVLLGPSVTNECAAFRCGRVPVSQWRLRLADCVYQHSRQSHLLWLPQWLQGNGPCRLLWFGDCACLLVHPAHCICRGCFGLRYQ
jgi:hypothetical protein